MQLIGAFTSVFAGNCSALNLRIRYFEPKSNLGFDVCGSNAIGQNQLGGLVTESGASVGFNVHWLFRGGMKQRYQLYFPIALTAILIAMLQVGL